MASNKCRGFQRWCNNTCEPPNELCPDCERISIEDNRKRQRNRGYYTKIDGGRTYRGDKQHWMTTNLAVGTKDDDK